MIYMIDDDELQREKKSHSNLNQQPHLKCIQFELISVKACGVLLDCAHSANTF